MQELSEDIIDRMRAIDKWVEWANTQREEDLKNTTVLKQVSETLGEDGVKMLREIYGFK
jgi:hypothetical protein